MPIFKLFTSQFVVINFVGDFLLVVKPGCTLKVYFSKQNINIIA